MPLCHKAKTLAVQTNDTEETSSTELYKFKLNLKLKFLNWNKKLVSLVFTNKMNNNIV